MTWRNEGDDMPAARDITPVFEGKDCTAIEKTFNAVALTKPKYRSVEPAYKENLRLRTGGSLLVIIFTLNYDF